MRFHMHVWVAVLAGACVSAPLAARGENPCTNGSFEKLGASGFPEDWEAVGLTVGVAKDAHSGRYALRILRTADTKTPETGLNRAWRARSGERGAMIDRLKGGIDFWYKAVSAAGAALRVQAIPMSADPLENTGSARATFAVPAGHVGDGQWHRGRLKYDFTGDEKVKWVHFAARIVGTAGELLLDDVRYVERVGVILRFGRIHIEEDADRPGKRGTLRALLLNAGDEPARDVRVSVTPPKGVKAEPGTVRIPLLQPDGRRRAALVLDGERDHGSTIRLAASAGAGGAGEARASFAIEAKLVLQSFGPVAPVFVQEEPIALECVLVNEGHGMVRDVSAVFRCERQAVTREAAAIAPGRAVVLKASLPWQTAVKDSRASVGVRSPVLARALVRRSRFQLVQAAAAPPPSGRLTASADKRHAVLENEHVRLVFHRLFRPSGTGDFGPVEVCAKTPAGWRRVAWMPQLARARYEFKYGSISMVSVSSDPPTATVGPEGEDAAQRRRTAQIRFHWPIKGCEGKTVSFSLAAGEKTVACRWRLSDRHPHKLLACWGPMLYVLDRREAVFPGLEWLTRDEVSSSALDIAGDHPHRKRYVVHPDMVTIPAVGLHGSSGTVGLMWDCRQRWDGRRRKPSVVFASPDRWGNQRSHLIGLFVPSVGEFVEPNHLTASKPYPWKAGQPLELGCRIYVDGAASDALAVIDEYLKTYGLPNAHRLPHGSWLEEVQFSMRAYLESLWDAQTKQWWTSKGGHPLMCRLARPRMYIADLLLGAAVCPSAEVRRRCERRAEEVLEITGGPARWDAQRFGGRADLAMANPARAAGLLASRGDDGAWRFDADRKDQGVFKGKDYCELGPDGAVEVGTCARNAFAVLNYARIAGDRRAYERMVKTLERMETFRVPRAAQVWEVPVHTPDILAAADAVDAYVEAYRFSGEKRWLADAVAWARRGLPFVYLWRDEQKPWLLGASIPVFGATWYRGSWFGRPVQWNGLRYANALLKLAEHDQSRPWREIAALLIRSATHQQDQGGENAALWPDNISAIDGRKCPWVFAPRQIIRNILKLTGRDEDPRTVIVGEGKRRLHISAAGGIEDAAWDGKVLTFRVRYPKGREGVVLVSNVTRPARVSLNGKAITERADVEKGDDPGWRHDPAYAYLSIRVAQSGASAVRVDGAAFCDAERVPRFAKEIRFTFDESTEGWLPAHHVSGFSLREGAIVGRITGIDPYLVRPYLRAAGDDCPVVRIRMRLTAGRGGQFFWTTASSPQFSEGKSIRFAVRADGKMHEYRLEPGGHRLEGRATWAGRTITAIRIDPGGGADGGEFEIDSVIGSAR